MSSPSLKTFLDIFPTSTSIANCSGHRPPLTLTSYFLESWRQYLSIEYWNIPGGGLWAEQFAIKVGLIFQINIDFLCSFSILGFSRYIYLVIRFKLLSYTTVYCTLYTCTPVCVQFMYSTSLETLDLTWLLLVVLWNERKKMNVKLKALNLLSEI